MARLTLDTLQTMNRDFFGGRWSDADLQQLVAPSFGVVSSFEHVLADLANINARDLGDTPPDEPGAEKKA